MARTPPVFEFRYLPFLFGNNYVRRYAEGKWLLDDGHFDIAFIGRAQRGYHTCLYFEHGRENIICSWTSDFWFNLENRKDYSSRLCKHHEGNPWHYALRKGATSWGDCKLSWVHPNEIACRLGMETLSREFGGASGNSIQLNADDKHIAAGLVRYKDTKKVFRWSNKLKCMYCEGSPNSIIKTTKEKTFSELLGYIESEQNQRIERVVNALDRR